MLRSAHVISTGHAFVQNRRGHYELATHVDSRNRIPAAFAELVHAIQSDLIWRHSGQPRPLPGSATCLDGLGYTRHLRVLERKLEVKPRPLAGTAVQPHCPADGFHAVFQADQTGAMRGICSADAIVTDRKPQELMDPLDKINTDVNR